MSVVCAFPHCFDKVPNGNGLQAGDARGGEKDFGSAQRHYSPDEEQSPEAQAKIATDNTTLHQACCQNQSEVVEALLTGGADVNLVNNSQHSALYYATENGFTEIVEQLLMAGAEG